MVPVSFETRAATGGVALAAIVGVALLGVAVAGSSTTVDAGTPAVQDDGSVAIVAVYPTDDGAGRETLVTDEDFAEVGEVQDGRRNPYFTITLTDDAADRFVGGLRARGFLTEGTNACRSDWKPDDPGYCLQTVRNGSVVYSASLSPGLAEDIDDGEFQEDPTFRLTSANRSEAERLRAAVTGEPATTTGTGALPTPGLTPGVAALGLLVALASLRWIRRE